MCFSNPREMSFSDPLTGLRLWGLTYSFLGSKERLQPFPLSPGWLDTVLGLLALGITWAAPEDPWPHGSTSLPGWSFPAPRKHYAHEEGWVALGTIFLHFWAFSTVFDSNRQNAPGPILGAKCHRLLLPVGFATRRCLVNESQIHKSLSYHSLLPMSHMKYITVHKILWAQTLAHMRTLKHSVLRGQSSHSTTKINESYFELSYPMMVDDNIYQKYYKW